MRSPTVKSYITLTKGITTHVDTRDFYFVKHRRAEHTGLFSAMDVSAQLWVVILLQHRKPLTLFPSLRKGCITYTWRLRSRWSTETSSQETVSWHTPQPCCLTAVRTDLQRSPARCFPLFVGLLVWSTRYHGDIFAVHKYQNLYVTWGSCIVFYWVRTQDGDNSIG